MIRISLTYELMLEILSVTALLKRVECRQPSSDFFASEISYLLYILFHYIVSEKEYNVQQFEDIEQVK